MRTLRCLFNPWTWTMAWRDSRRERRRLIVFSLSILFGIAALVAIGSLNRNLGDAVEDQAKELLGADLMLSSRRPFVAVHDAAQAKNDGEPPAGSRAAEDAEHRRAAEEIIDAIPGRRSEEVSFTTMIYFPGADESKLVNIRGTDPQFPFYGEVITDPPEAWDQFGEGEGVVLEAGVAGQFGIRPGDVARVGTVELPVLGVLVKAPPQGSAFAALAPQVFMPREKVGETGLVGDRSLAFYRVYFALPDDLADEAVIRDRVVPEASREALRSAGVRVETVDGRKRDLGRLLDNLYSFFSLIGFVALLLGGLGIASAIHVHVSQRLRVVATLRCLGCSPSQAMAVFLAQGIALGALGAVAGAAAGVALQQWVPLLFRDQLPFVLRLDVSWTSILIGTGIGFLICICFALLPLLKVRRVPPLAALRAEAAPVASGFRDPATWVALAVLVAALGVLARALSPDRLPWLGFGFVGGLGAITLVLAGCAKLVMLAARRLVRPSWPYVLRQGLANLHRPRNQTMLFLLSAGLGVCLILTLLLSQRMLVEQLGVKTLEGKPDTYLIDVQGDQRDEVRRIFGSLGLEPMEEAAMISMRLSGLKGMDIAEAQQHEESRVPGWILRRDFRSTYRAELGDAEELIRGEWISEWREKDLDEPIPVSLEEGIASDLRLDLGDEFRMDVQGLDLTLRVASIRRVDWRSMGLNFFIVFPVGVLEEAPSFNVLTTRTPTDEVSGALNREVVKRFPNITVFDASLVLDSLLSIAGKVGLVIQFMALFTAFTGVIILIGTLMSGKRDRVEESVLLRTLGASRAQIWRILVTEYFLLGLFAALTGSVLALAATWALARWVFEVGFLSHATPIILAILGLTAATVVVGLVLSRGITSHPPLTILRAEGR